MNNKKFLSLLLLLVFPFFLWAGGTFIVIKGKAGDYSGDTLIFQTYSNMVSFREMEIGKCAVDDSGFFECSIPLKETQHIFAHLGIYNCYLYAQPGMIYNVQLPRKREKSLQDNVNPYFEETSIHLSVRVEGNTMGGPVPPPDEELNFTIRAFNDSFYPYYYKFVINAYGNRVDRKELNKAEEEVRAPFDSLEGSFLKAYIDYRMGLLNHYGSQISSQNIIREYFLGKAVLLQNPAYMELFNQVCKDYFIAFYEEHPGSKLPTVLNRDKNYAMLNSILIKEASLENDSLRELVLLKGLYDGFYDGKNIPSSMVQLLDSLRYNSSIEVHRQVVKDIMLEITKLLPGYKPPDFTLYNSDSTLVRLSDFEGTYVYLNFCNSFGYYCVREYEYLRILKERLKDRISIVTILVDDNRENMKELVESNNYPWTFLHFANQPDVLDGYDIRSYPSYFLIGPKGKLILSPAPSPAENFELTFLRISSNQEL
ncbi:peroxiredoxin family protein [Bacteroidota bacterium]